MLRMTPEKLVTNPLVILAKSSLGLLFACLALSAQAQESCGNFIYDYYGEDEYFPIENCEDPFKVSSAEAVGDFSYQLLGAVMVEGEEREVADFPAHITLTTPVSSAYNIKRFELYRHEGQDYRHIDTHGFNEPSPVTLTALATGTYTIYTSLEQNYGWLENRRPWWDTILDKMVPIAHAQSIPRSIRSTITFTLVSPLPELGGAANVLFIPGIMGSRLYEVGDFCGGDSGNEEQELWFSTDACRQLRLTTKFTGQSNNKIYTKTNDEGIFDDAYYFTNIYDSFLAALREWKVDGVINNYVVFPYDWRLSLDDILTSRYDAETGKTFPGVETAITDGLLYKLINQLAKSADNGKVTIVAHSNGGLVTKQLIRHLTALDDPLLKKIDAIILVAVPQLGAPNTAVGILHGEELNYVMEQGVTRQLMNTMPFSYHLLPTERYFDTVSTPLITIESGTSTDLWRSEFGAEFTSLDGLHDFLSRESGRVEPATEDLATPEIADPLLLQYAKTTSAMQEEFAPPSNIKVYQVAGTGLPTPSQLTYFTDKACVNSVLFICTEYAPKLGYRVVMTVDGDATVPVPSALALPEAEDVERWWINLLRYNSQEIDRQHRDIFEVAELPDFIKSIVSSTETEYRYFSNEQPAIENANRLIFQLHSPLDLSIKTAAGLVVSSTTSEVPGALYRRFGELQYLSVPWTEDIEVILTGEASGSFTLDIEEGDGAGVAERVTMSGIPVTANSKVRMEVSEAADIETLVLGVDYDGDAVVDVTYDKNGIQEEAAVTYEDLYETIAAVDMKRGPEAVLRALAETAERFAKKAETKPKFTTLEHKTLKALIRQSILYKKLRLLTAEEQEKIESIAQLLINTI